MIHAFDHTTGIVHRHCESCHTLGEMDLHRSMVTDEAIMTTCDCGAVTIYRRVHDEEIAPHPLVGTVLEGGNIVAEITIGQATTDLQREQLVHLNRIHTWLLRHKR